eukprot:scaffold126828_cov15-Tisochrysis_lutea.AAC.1
MFIKYALHGLHGRSSDVKVHKEGTGEQETPKINVMDSWCNSRFRILRWTVLGCKKPGCRAAQACLGTQSRGLGNRKNAEGNQFLVCAFELNQARRSVNAAMSYSRTHAG